MKFPNSFRLFDKEPEAIKGAVVRYNDEEFVKPNHQLAVDAAKERFGEYDLSKEQARGWKTTKGRIVSEEEAHEIEARRELRKGEESALRTDPESTLFKEKNE